MSARAPLLSPFQAPPVLAGGLSAVPTEGVAFLARHPNATARQLAERCQVSRATAHRWLQLVRAAGDDEIATELEDAGRRHSAMAQIMVRRRRRIQ